MAEPWRPSGYETPQWQELYGEKYKRKKGSLRPGWSPLGGGAPPKPPGWTPEIKAQQRQQYVSQQQALAKQATALQQGGTNAMVIGGQLVTWPAGGTPPPLAQWQHQAQWDVGQRQGQQVGGGAGPYPQLAGTSRPTQQQQAPQMSMMLQQPAMAPPAARLPQQTPQVTRRQFVTTQPPTQQPQMPQRQQPPTQQPLPQPMPQQFPTLPMGMLGAQLAPQIGPQAMYQPGFVPGTQLPQNALLAELLRLGY